MASAKAGKTHHEEAPPVLNETSVKYTPKSTKRTVTALFKSIFSCSPQPLTWTWSHIRPHYKHSSHDNGNSPHFSIKAHLSTIDPRSTSKASVVTSSIRHSFELAPKELINSVKAKDDGVKDEPVELSDTRIIYQSMPYDNSIRLLRIHKGGLTDPVEFALEFSRLDDTIPRYEALSYVWGSNSTVSHIFEKTTQTPIPVTRNLYDALKGVRQTERDRILWVDALCINQGDGKEKGTQVRRMNSIYTSAARVIVWLGTDDAGDAAGAFAVLCSLANTEGGCAHYETTSPSFVPQVPDKIPDIRNYEAWRKVMTFFCQTWFTRLWVLQEIVLAQDALLIWGDCSVSWNFVGAAIDAIRKIDLFRSLLQTRNLENAFLMWHLSTVRCDATCSDGDQKPDQPGVFVFLHLLDMARGFEVTDPRDKVYGLLGFPTSNNDLTAQFLLPDYSLSVVMVYVYVTHGYIYMDANINILALVLYEPSDLAQSKDHIHGMPSWVPNFNSKATAAPISNINIDHEYSAGSSRPLRFMPSADSLVLRLEGTTLDTIRRVGPRIPFVQAHKAQHHLNSLVQWYTEAGVQANELAMILTGGRDKDGRLLWPSQKEKCVAFLQKIIRDLGLDISATTEHTWILDTNGGLEWKHTIWRFVTYRQPFITDTGRYGLGPQGSKEGDAVAVLWGGQCPFIISDAGQNEWTLNGECYVEAWMNGEVVAELVREERKESVVFDFV